jgi:hypothetical protein
MGKTTLIKIETADKQIKTLCFLREALGEDRYTEVRHFEIGEHVRAEVQPTSRVWRIPDTVVDVVQFTRGP